MASAVATPLEKQFSTIAGIDQMTSTSNLGSTGITISFSLDRNIDAAAQDVQAMIAKTLKDLPPGIIPPSYNKVNPADQPILYYAFTSPLMKLSDLDEYAETMMAQRISMVPGVAQVNVYGAQKYAVRVQLDPSAMAQRKIGIDEVANAISSQNVNLPTGYSQRSEQDVHAAGEWTAAGRGELPADGRQLQKRRARAFGRHRPGARRRAEQPRRRLVSHHARNDPRRAATAGHEHGGGRRRGKGAHRNAEQAAPGERRGHADVRPLAADQRIRYTTSSSRSC
jgi:multidrug efflux pump subunit AcrB